MSFSKKNIGRPLALFLLVLSISAWGFDDPRYKEALLLGSGSFGRVYKLKDNSVVKVSVLEQKFSSLQNIKEALVLTALDHPNIIKPISISIRQGDGAKYLEIALPLLYKINQEDTKNALTSMANALNYLHSINMAHRDIKEFHIMKDDKNNFFLIDFGAVEIFTTRPSLDRYTTLSYCSPEVLLCSHNMNTPQNDMWSLGVSLLFLNNKNTFAVPKEKREDVLYMYKKLDSLYDKYKNIESDTFVKSIEEDLAETPCFDVIKALLIYNSAARLSSKQLYEKFNQSNVAQKYALKDLPIFTVSNMLDMKKSLRSVMVCELIEVCMKHDLHDKVFFEAIAIIDQYIATVTEKRNDFYLLVKAAAYMANFIHGSWIDMDIILNNDTAQFKWDRIPLELFDDMFLNILEITKFNVLFDHVFRRYQTEIYGHDDEDFVIAVLKLLEVDENYFDQTPDFKWQLAQKIVKEKLTKKSTEVLFDQLYDKHQAQEPVRRLLGKYR